MCGPGVVILKMCKTIFWFLFIFSGVMVISGWFSYYRMVQSEKAL